MHSRIIQLYLGYKLLQPQLLKLPSQAKTLMLTHASQIEREFEKLEGLLPFSTLLSEQLTGLANHLGNANPDTLLTTAEYLQQYLAGEVAIVEDNAIGKVDKVYARSHVRQVAEKAAQLVANGKSVDEAVYAIEDLLD